MTAHIPIEYQHLIRYEPEYAVLICRPCKMAVGKKGLPRHLRERHMISPQERKSLIAALDSLSIIESEESFPQLADRSEPIKGLDIHNAYKCNSCKFITKSDQLIRRPVRNLHSETQALPAVSSKAQ